MKNNLFLSALVILVVGIGILSAAPAYQDRGDFIFINSALINKNHISHFRLQDIGDSKFAVLAQMISKEEVVVAVTPSQTAAVEDMLMIRKFLGAPHLQTKMMDR